MILVLCYLALDIVLVDIKAYKIPILIVPLALVNFSLWFLYSKSEKKRFTGFIIPMIICLFATYHASSFYKFYAVSPEINCFITGVFFLHPLRYYLKKEYFLKIFTYLVLATLVFQCAAHNLPQDLKLFLNGKYTAEFGAQIGSYTTDMLFGTFGHKNIFYSVLIAKALLLSVLFLKLNAKFLSISSGILLTVMVALSSFQASSRTAFVVSCLVMGFFLFLLFFNVVLKRLFSGKALTITFLTVCIICAGLVLVFAKPLFFKMQQNRGSQATSVLEVMKQDIRFGLSRLCVEYVTEKPIWGHGVDYFYTNFSKERDYLSKDGFVYHGIFGNARYAHNDLLQFTAEYGIAGAVLILFYLIVFFTGLLRQKDPNLILLGVFSLLIFLVFLSADFISRVPSVFCSWFLVISLCQKPKLLKTSWLQPLSFVVICLFSLVLNKAHLFKADQIIKYNPNKAQISREEVKFLLGSTDYRELLRASQKLMRGNFVLEGEKEEQIRDLILRAEKVMPINPKLTQAQASYDLLNKDWVGFERKIKSIHKDYGHHFVKGVPKIMLSNYYMKRAIESLELRKPDEALGYYNAAHRNHKLSKRYYSRHLPNGENRWKWRNKYLMQNIDELQDLGIIPTKVERALESSLEMSIK